MHFAPMWLLAVAATALLCGGIEGRVFEMPAAMQQSPPQSPPSSAYAQALRDAYAEALNANANHGGVSAATSDAEEEAAAMWLGDNTPAMSSYFLGRQNAQLLPQAEKRVKPSLSISNSLDVLRQQVMLEFVRRQMRENMKQVKMNRDHLDTIGKRSEPIGKRQETVDRTTRQQTHAAENNGLYRLALRNRAAGQFGDLE